MATSIDRWASSVLRRGLPSLALAALLILGGCDRQQPGELPSAQQLWSELAGDRSLERLNVVLITIDTLRADRLSSYGSRRVQTPHMDRLAREGVRFVYL